MKKIIFIFMLTLSLLLLTSCGDKESQLFEFGLRIENSCSVDGLKSEDATSINIPLTYDNRQVKYIGRNAFEGNEKLISVIIPEGVEYIESYAFKGCSNLENISLPSSVKEIEYGISSVLSFVKALRALLYITTQFSFTLKVETFFSIPEINAT